MEPNEAEILMSHVRKTIFDSMLVLRLYDLSASSKEYAQKVISGIVLKVASQSNQSEAVGLNAYHRIVSCLGWE